PNLLREEEKEFVLVRIEFDGPEDWASDVVAHGVKTVERARPTLGFVKCVVRVVILIAVVIVGLAVKCLSTGLHRLDDGCAAALTVFCLVIVQQDFHFADCLTVQRRIETVAAASRVAVNAVNADGIADLARAGNSARALGSELLGAFAVFYNAR